MYHLFEKYGIELEYMIVNKDLRVFPITDKIIESANGTVENEIRRGELSWSNELVLHVIEIKTGSPVNSLNGLAQKFHESVKDINRIADKFGGVLVGGPMHPFMDPYNEMYLWPHGYNSIYESFNRIFSCKGHGWSNLQSMHINLPFANDEEFGRLHAAIRFLLPLIPALSAGSPIVDGKVSGFMDTRMEVYRTNSSLIPSITGEVIPEPVYSISEYHEKILQKIYDDLAKYDKDSVLQHEWVNARGAIARFERNTIEIRVIDAQETPFADIAIAAVIAGVLKQLAFQKFCSYESQKQFETPLLKEIFLNVIKNGEKAIIDNPCYLHCLGIKQDFCSAAQVWSQLIDTIILENSTSIAPFYSALEIFKKQGTLASRILKAVGNEPDGEKILSVYRSLSDCLDQGKLFTG